LGEEGFSSGSDDEKPGMNFSEGVREKRYPPPAFGAPDGDTADPHRNDLNARAPRDIAQADIHMRPVHEVAGKTGSRTPERLGCFPADIGGITFGSKGIQRLMQFEQVKERADSGRN
jgi:hypothetical protein